MEEKVMSRLKQAVKMLRYNFSSIAFFEIVYRVLSLAILTPAMYGLLNVSMDIAGVSYLSSGTIYRYMRSPITYVAFLLILILIAFFLLINLSGIIYSMEASVRREKLNPMDIFLPESDTEESAHTWLCIVCSAIHIFADIVRHVARLEAAGIFDTFSEEL